MKEKTLFVFLLIALAFLASGTAAAVAGPEAEALDRVRVDRFEFTGNTVFTGQELSEALAGFSGRFISPGELEEARRTVTAYYVDRGYVNSGALIPDQKITDGVVRIRVEEGRLSGITVSGNTHLKAGYVKSRLERAAGEDKPLNYHSVLLRLRLLKDDPRIENIHAKILPGLIPGSASLAVEVKEAKPYQLSLITDNHRSPSVGSFRGMIRFTHMDVTGWGDSLFLQYGLTEGLNEYAGRYSFPVTRWDTRIGAYAERYASDIVIEPFKELDITSETTRYGGFVRQPVYRTLRREAALELEIQNTRNQVKLAGEPFSFSPYEEGQQGIYKVTPLRFHQDYVDRGMGHVFAFRSTFSFGLDLWGATWDVDEQLFGKNAPSADFFAWLGQAQFLWRTQRLWDSQLVFRASSQLTPDRLLPSEQYGLGGYATVRGYREYVMTTDNGANASVEWQVPVWRKSFSWFFNKPREFAFYLVPFFDWGRGWNNGEAPDPDPDSIYSLGLGVTAAWGNLFSAACYYGKALRDVPEPTENDLQDDGISFSVQVNLF